MQFRGLDGDGDFMMGQGLGSYAFDEAAVGLDIATRVRAIQGNCFWALTDGVDYRNLLEKNRRKELIIAISNAILQANGVVKINSMSANFDPATRSISISYDVQTIFSRSFKATLDNVTGAPNA